MRTRFLRGTTSENNGLTLPTGELSVDLEKKAVRLHDGSTLGGFEILGVRAIETLPGNDTFLAGNSTKGFYGEVPGTDFISYGDLSSQVGLSAGDLQHDAESTWLKFRFNNETLFIAKKSARHSISWNDLNGLNIVFNSDISQIIQIGSYSYRVTLLKGGYNQPNEWDDLIFPVHISDYNNEEWGIDYTDSDLIVTAEAGLGSYSWTQATGSGGRYRHGGSTTGIASSTVAAASSNGNFNGWRPCLRLVE